MVFNRFYTPKYTCFQWRTGLVLYISFSTSLVQVLALLLFSNTIFLLLLVSSTLAAPSEPQTATTSTASPPSSPKAPASSTATGITSSRPQTALPPPALKTAVTNAAAARLVQQHRRVFSHGHISFGGQEVLENSGKSSVASPVKQRCKKSS